MIHNPNSPWRNKNKPIIMTSESKVNLDKRINEMLAKGYTLISQTEQEPFHITSYKKNAKTRKYEELSISTVQRKHIAVMKRGN